jgi:hypothetical protein
VRLLAVIIPLAALCASGGAGAQSLAMDPARPDAAVRAMHGLALCAARRRPVAEKMLTVLPETSEGRRLINLLVDPLPDCELGGSQIGFQARYMRGGVAEALYRQDFESSKGQSGQASAAVFQLPSMEEGSQLSDGTKGSIGMIMFGQCVARTNLQGISALLATRVTTGAERKAFADLDPSMRQCAPNSALLNVGRLQLRGYLAEGAYRAASATAEVS